MRKMSEKIISFILSLLIVLQIGGMAAFAENSADYDSSKNNETLIKYAVGNDIPTDGGIWINSKSQEYFLSVFNNISEQNYSVDENGYLVQETDDKSTVNDYDKKLRKLINSRKTIAVDISDVYYAYNDTFCEDYSVMLEDSDFALLFETDSKLSVAVLNFYHYAEHRNEHSYNNETELYTDNELADEFLKLFFNDETSAHNEGEGIAELPKFTRGATLPRVGNYVHFTSGTYGKSGLGEDLKWYKIGTGPNVVFAVFAQHGWEDAWSADGAELVKIADRVMENLSSMNQNIFYDWTVYIIPYANPDGITSGYTNNGPGRCTVTTEIDMNRCWPADFTPVTSSDRNYTGKSPLGAPEASQLERFLSSNMGKYTNVVLDVHGWLNQTIGNSQVGNYFVNEFKGNGFYHKSSHGRGYLETWAYNKGAESCLVEFPMPKNAASIISNDYSGKFTNALVNMMNGFTDKNPIVLNPVEKTPVASRVTGVTANISWNAVPLADGYYVEILSDKKGDNWHGAGTTVISQFNFRNLEFGHSYSVRVKPYRYSSKGIIYADNFSHSCGFSTLDKNDAAAAIERIVSLNLRNISDTSLDVLYEHVTGANRYRIEISSDKENWQTVLNTDKAEANITGLIPESSYYVRVTGYAVSGEDIVMSDKYSPIYHFYTKPKDIAVSHLGFEDLTDYSSYSGYVAYTSVYNKFITGTNPPANNVFEPARAIDRAMMVTILYRMAGEPYANGGNPYTSSPFTDITDTSVYYYDAACWALKNGVTTETTFKPFNNVTREQTATFLYRYAQDNGTIGDEAYKNVNLNAYHDGNSISHFAVDAMKWANYNSMITGTEQGYANPQGATQRIHATKILYGFGKTSNIGNFK